MKTQQHKKRRHRPRIIPGAPPGSLLVDPEAPAPILSVLAYGPNEMVEHALTDPQQVRDFVGKWPVTWVNVEGLGDAETIRVLGEIFHLHKLALEDVVNAPQRPKVEEYGEHLFIVTRMARLTEHLEMEQLSLFLGRNFVLTFQEGRPGDCLGPLRDSIHKSRGHIRQAGTDYLAYSLLDAVVDSYFPLLEEYGERLETQESRLVLQPATDTAVRIHAIKRDLLALRRSLWPQRETFNTLLRDPMPLVSDETRLHLRDCYDHAIQLIDLIETYRELASDLTDVYLSSISNRTNETMRVLTVIATIFIPLTFIAGVYGMNFNPEASPWNMPELNWYWGYPLSLGLMLIVAFIELMFFWRRGWIRVPQAEQKSEDTERSEAESQRS